MINRKEEYKHICHLFDQQETLKDAHQLSGSIFGIIKTNHYKGYSNMNTDSLIKSLEIPPIEMEINTKKAIANQYQNSLENNQMKLQAIQAEINDFLTDENLEKHKKELENMETILELLNLNNRDITNQLLNLSKQIELKMQEIHKIKENIQIPLKLASFKETLACIQIIKQNIQKIKSVYIILENDLDRKQDIQLRIEENQDNIQIQNEELVLKTT